ncbi:MAG: chorismate synthase [Chlamydiae bacterium]|nr:chorismate synthase [Chlamydiota bacterium]
MGSNSFGEIFKITTWGESHGKALGVVIDGCPAGLLIDEEEINQDLSKRRPSQSKFVTGRNEPDKAEILSGVFEGKTTGAPICIIIYNQDQDSSSYEPIKHLLRPGHANFTYLEKYGTFDYRGGGRASARETVCRVAAASIAKKILKNYGIEVVAYIKKIGEVEAKISFATPQELRKKTLQSAIFCPDEKGQNKMIKILEDIIEEGDSIGAVVECQIFSVPTGLGDPVYQKLEAKLANGILSIPGTKGFEIGEGFSSAMMKGSEYDDLFILNDQNKVVTKTNHAGGTLGGISTGMPIIFNTAFKPASSIKKTLETLSIDHKKQRLELPKNSRHDPCIAIRGVSVVEAMAVLVLADAILLQKAIKHF